MTPANTQRTGTRHRVVLRLLDHQLVGPDDQLLGNVDDLQLLKIDGRWRVTALVVGPAALGQRLPGKLGTWMVAIWRRLQARPEPGPAVVPISQLTGIGSALGVNQDASEVLAASFGLELWLCTYVVSRIPGAKGGGDDRSGAAQGNSIDMAPDEGHASDDTTTTSGGSRVGEALAADAGSREARSQSISSLIQAKVFDQDGVELGRVTEVFCVEPARGPRDHLLLTHLEYSNHVAGAELGYDEHSAQGPLLVGSLVRWWQRGSRVAPMSDVTEMDLAAGRVTLRSQGDHVHPHEL